MGVDRPTAAGGRPAGDDEDVRRATRGYLLARVLAAPPTAAFAVRSDRELQLVFWLLFALAVASGLVALAVAFSAHWRRLRPERTLPADVLVLAGLVALSGGAQSELRDLVIAMMIAPAIVLAPRVVAATGGALLAAYLLVALPDVAQDEPGAASAALAFTVGLGWATGTAVALSHLRVTASRRVTSLLSGRRILLGGVLDSEARERRRFTGDIHEGPLQFLLAARQDIEEAREGDPTALGRAEAGVLASIEALRETVASVHPVALDHGGLAAALRAVAERAAARGGFRAQVEVDPATEGLRDDVLVNVARELIANVAEHAAPGLLQVTVEAGPGVLVLVVADDGIGFVPAAVRAQAVGLAACEERVAAADGRFELDSAPGRGTRVRVELPPPVRAARRGG